MCTEEGSELYIPGPKVVQGEASVYVIEFSACIERVPRHRSRAVCARPFIFHVRVYRRFDVNSLCSCKDEYRHELLTNFSLSSITRASVGILGDNLRWHCSADVRELQARGSGE